MSKIFGWLFCHLALCFVFAFLIILPVFGADVDDIKTTFKYLEQGYEQKSVDILTKCFVKMSDKQRKAYADIFKVTKNYDVTIVTTNTTISPDKSMARADVTLTFKYNIVVGSYSQPQEKTKQVSYLMYKAGARWCILGTSEVSTTSTLTPVTDQNYEEINAALAKLPPEVRQKLFSTPIVSKKRPAIQWAVVPGADSYVISITKDDVSKIKETQMYWRLEKYRLTSADIPATILDKLTVGGTYYFNAFAYTDKDEAISGNIIKFTYVNE